MHSKIYDIIACMKQVTIQWKMTQQRKEIVLNFLKLLVRRGAGWLFWEYFAEFRAKIYKRKDKTYRLFQGVIGDWYDINVCVPQNSYVET